MPKFRKDVEVEAFQFTAAMRSGEESMPGWASGVLYPSHVGRDVQWNIPHASGPMIVEDGDYVIATPTGEVYTVKPDIFEATYGRVESD